MSHRPVLLNEVIQALAPKPGEFFVDGTMNGGGHAAEILKRILPGGRLLGVDWDKRILERGYSNVAERLEAPEEEVRRVLTTVHGNYADIPVTLSERALPKADGFLLDLGFSSEQLEGGGRGFSFQRDEPLYMTYDGSRKPVAEMLRELDEEELAKVIFELSGERFSRKIAKAIKAREKFGPIVSSGELAEVIRKAVPGSYERGRIDPATRTFQALRIYANDELGNLRRVLERLPEMMAKGGRVAVITFHSLEDKIVKEAFRELVKEKKAELLSKKPITASEEEIKENSRSRSAKLRALSVL